MASASATHVVITGAMVEFFKDNASALEIVTTTDDNGVVHFVPNPIPQPDGSRLSDVPIDRLLSLLLETCNNAVPREGTNEDLGLVIALLAANEGGGDTTFRDLRKHRTIVDRAFKFLVSSTTTSEAPRCDVPQWGTQRTYCYPQGSG